MSAINDLPIELYSLIFKKLSINDLFNCRLVNKKFKLSAYVSVDELVIGELNKFNNYWYFNNKLIEDKNIISLKCFKSIRSLSIFYLNKHLKYLRVNWNDGDEFNLDEELKCLNDFINLKSLEIYSLRSNLKLNVNLKNLKYFAAYNLNGNFELNTPKLEKSLFYYMKKINIKSNLESIKHLIICDANDQLQQFKNLEIIQFICGIPIDLNENLLFNFKNLKQLKIDIDEHKSNFNLELEDRLIKILDKRSKLNKDIDIYFEGVKIMYKQKLNEFKLCESILEYQINNYDLLDSNPLRFTSIYYSNLVNHFDNIRNNLSSSFFDKYQNLSVVRVLNDNKLIDAISLNWFLNNLKCLRELEIENVLLDQHFFNNLPNTIKYLSIANYNEPSLYLNIDFNFILKLTELIDVILSNVSIKIDFFDLISKSFLNLKYLKRFLFILKKGRVLVHKKDNYYYFDYKNEIKLDYNQFVNKLNQIKLEINQDIQ